MLLAAGVTRAAGSVDSGDTVMDHMDQERERGITIGAAATAFSWTGHAVNLIDTPGHVDFTIEVERTTRVLDGAALIVDAVAGAQAQTETVWRQARAHGVPAVAFVNKMDREGADFGAALDSLERRLDLVALAVQLPLVADGGALRGAVDLVEMTALVYAASGGGGGGGGGGRAQRGAPLALQRQSLVEGAAASAAEVGGRPWDEVAEEAAAARAELVERVAELDGEGEVARLYLEERDVPAELLRDAIRTLTIERAAVPALCGASLHGVGVEPLLDAICAYLPSPADRPPPTVRAMPTEAPTADEALERRVDPADGNAYTRAEFVKFYGGKGEWRAAKPAPASASASATATAPATAVELSLAEAAETVALAFKVVARRPLEEASPTSYFLLPTSYFLLATTLYMLLATC